eukprot:4819529-Amphidinium_carterae.1
MLSCSEQWGAGCALYALGAKVDVWLGNGLVLNACQGSKECPKGHPHKRHQLEKSHKTFKLSFSLKCPKPHMLQWGIRTSWK